MQVPSKERESRRQQVSFPLYLSLGPYHALESLCTEFVRHLSPSDFMPPPRSLDSDQNGCKCDHFLSVQVQILHGCIGASSCCSSVLFFFTSLVHALRYNSPVLLRLPITSPGTLTPTRTQSHTVGSVMVIMRVLLRRITYM